jgi:four helix bundle protein
MGCAVLNVSYRSLEIWKLARMQSIEIHQMTMTLPKFEMYEEGQQIRHSSKSVRAAIVEGYGRKRYAADYIKFLTYSMSSHDETVDHLETLFETGSLQDEAIYKRLLDQASRLGKMIRRYIDSVDRGYK